MTEEEWKARNRERMRAWRAANPEQARYAASSEQARYASNPERARERNRRYREANRAQELNRSRRYREANRAQDLERKRRYREANRERNREQNREASRRYREANRERARITITHASQTRRARKRGAIDPCQPVTRAIVGRRNMLFGNVCCFCGASGRLTLEHVVALANGGLHVPSNLAPACGPCNSSKQDTPVEAWYPRQPFFDPVRWEFLQANTGNRWAVAEQLSLAFTLPAPTPAAPQPPIDGADRSAAD
jgi:5-methylcytosine-specific restriction endonuclease McrA